MVDCTGNKSLLRDRLLPDGERVDGLTNTHTMLSHTLASRSSTARRTTATEQLGKYYKNVGTERYSPSPPTPDVQRRRGHPRHRSDHADLAEDYAAMPTQFDGRSARRALPDVGLWRQHFVEKIEEESHGEIIGDLDIIRIPLNLYPRRSRHEPAAVRGRVPLGHSARARR